MLDDGSQLENNRSAKRRRINGNDARYSSPDELAASSDHEPSYHQRTNSIPHRDPADQIRRRDYNDSVSEDSPDELDHTIHTFYRDSWSRSQRQSRDAPSNPSPMITPRIATPPRKEPTFISYKPKMVLRGHRRGVAAVRFSPDGQSIASCCE
jgi:COMPASS component SWD3